jgi:hypothetical protein
MEEIVVTRLWMAGVVTMMAVFAIIALIGYLRLKSNRNPDRDRGRDSLGS